ncbi:MAG: cyanophycinase [Bacteroidetes bacterium]|nr:MAG: cyanophycinase [Bacteroidota bacterium]
MKLFLALIIVIIFLFSCEQPVEQSAINTHETEGCLFIIGGGSRPDHLVNRMIDEAGLRNGGYVVILPMSSAVPDSAIIWASEQFLKNGIENIAGFNFLPDETPPANWIDSLKNASLIYISGGDQNRFMSIAGENEIEHAIWTAYNAGAMIAGTSAGAAVMSEKMITGDELRYPDYSATFRTIESENMEIARGLGLINTAIIDQHFVWRSRHNRLFTAVIEYPELIGIGIDESTAIFVKQGIAEVVGNSQVMVFSNPKKSHIKKNNKLGARNLNVDIYLPGETFSIH